MKIKKEDNFFLFTEIKSSDLSNFLEYLDILIKKPVNSIISLERELINNHSLILSLVKYSTFWKKSDKSFILVIGDFAIENKNLISVPSLNEAIDYLYMEELERNV